MLNIFRKKLADYNYSILNTNYTDKEKKSKIKNKIQKDEYKNIIYYPYSSKE
jgi:hypothetical protein